MALFVIHRGTGTIINAHECALIVAEPSDDLNEAVDQDDVEEIYRLASSIVKITDLRLPTDDEVVPNGIATLHPVT